ncbi:hypothetical protein ElyMa_006173700 [Elysia marginata]|uniref:ZP domain-containing protein n=1 Tax=Elysia marginata TaxID=1093978 RepID=A0AAV4GZL7_9GAST|nr:hypothetical protein ElyMa_006173700 [Elysia marginata]
MNLTKRQSEPLSRRSRCLEREQSKPFVFSFPAKKNLFFLSSEASAACGDSVHVFSCRLRSGVVYSTPSLPLFGRTEYHTCHIRANTELAV